MGEKTFTGIVVGGGKRATALGFPTANIKLADTSVSGVYAARVVVGDTRHPAVAFADKERGLLEAHLLDFSGELYGQEVTIVLNKKIREAEVFTDDTKLRAAIESDIAEVGDFFVD
ncbi:MAG: riboflavin kinase [Patescibacteria group bacterium]|nr:riboflavin kinase [Patescibacteria group bacterium]